MDLLSTALGVENMPPEIATWLKTPQRADAFAAAIFEKCKWLALPKAKRADVVAAWALRIQVDAAADQYREWFSLTKEKRNEVIAKYEKAIEKNGKAIENAARLGTWWLDDQPVVNKAVRANWLELTLGGRRAFIEETMRISGSRIENKERETHIVDAMRLGWLRLKPEKQADLITKAFREWWSDLPAAERNALAISQVDDLRASIATETYLAWAFHAESGTPVRPALLTATACALGLANWTKEGRPFPVRAIRDPLGLPRYNDYPAFLSAARLSADPALTDARIAKLVGVSKGSVSGWKPHLANFAAASDDMFFPLGLDAVPDDTAVENELDERCEAIAYEITDERRARSQPIYDNKGNEVRGDYWRKVEDLPIGQRAFLFRCAVQIARHGWYAPAVFLDAMIAVLGLRKTVSTPPPHFPTPPPHLSPVIARAVGLPDDVNELAAFRAAAAHDAAALHAHVAATVSDSDLATFAAKVDELLAGEWLMTTRRDDRLATYHPNAALPAASTLRRWRAKPEYRRLVRTFTLMPVHAADFWKRKNG